MPPPQLWLLQRQYLQLHWNMLVPTIAHYIRHDVSTLWGGLFILLGFLEVKDSRNCNNQNGSNSNSPTMILPIFPTMLFDTKGQESIAPAKSTITGVSSSFKDNYESFCRCLLYLTGTKIIIWQWIMVEILLKCFLYFQKIYYFLYLWGVRMDQYLTAFLDAVFAFLPRQNWPKLTNRIVIFLLLKLPVGSVICC